MAKKIDVLTEAATVAARPDRWHFMVVRHERDESVPEGDKRFDVIIYFDDVIPQRKIKDVLAGMSSAKKKAVKTFFMGLSDIVLQGHADETGQAIVTDDEDALE